MTLLKKSKYLICYYTVVAVFSCLSLSALTDSFMRSGVLRDGLSVDSWNIQIYSSHSESTFLTRDLVQLLIEEDQPFILYKDGGVGYGTEFFLHNKDFPLDLSSNKDVNITESPIIIIEDTLLPNTIERDEGLYFFAYGNYHEVVGVLEGRINSINSNSLFFTSLDLEADILGNYFIDGKLEDQINQIVFQLQELAPQLIIETFKMQRSLQERLILTFLAQEATVIILGISILLVGISTIGNTLAWIDSRKDEINIRYIVGALTKNILNWLLKDYVLMISVSFFIGLTVSFLIWSSNIFIAILPYFNVIGIIMAFGLCIIIGLFTLFMSIILKSSKNEILKKEGI